VRIPRAPFAFVQASASSDGGCATDCHGALDRADHLRDDPAALSALWSNARVVLLDDAGRSAADSTGQLLAPHGHEISQGPGGVGAAVFLGLDHDGGGWFALAAALTAFVAPQWLDLRSAATVWPALDAGVFAQACALQHWRGRHRFCGACGGAVVLSRGGWLGRCEQCGLEHYPRTDPAVIVAVSDGSRLLLGRQSSWPPRRYSVVAGFVEPGETLEQCLAREVEEEVGIRVSRIRYFASQPWPFPHSLMIAFVCDWESGEIRPQAGEIEAADWFEVLQLPKLPSKISIARRLIDAEVQRIAGEMRAGLA